MGGGGCAVVGMAGGARHPVAVELSAAEGAVTSVGSRGDSYDNAMAESIIGLYKTELIYP